MKRNKPFADTICLNISRILYLSLLYLYYVHIHIPRCIYTFKDNKYFIEIMIGQRIFCVLPFIL